MIHEDIFLHCFSVSIHIQKSSCEFAKLYEHQFHDLSCLTNNVLLRWNPSFMSNAIFLESRRLCRFKIFIFSPIIYTSVLWVFLLIRNLNTNYLYVFVGNNFTIERSSIRYFEVHFYYSQSSGRRFVGFVIDK